MSPSIAKDLAALEQMTVGELHARYVQICGETVRSRHRAYLIRRISWRLQAGAEGGLTERALRRAEELANLADVRTTPPRAATQATKSATPPASATDGRLPPAGTAITRKYKGRSISVTVLAGGFEYEGQRYGSLSAVAKAITGCHMNGYRFFHLEGQP